nr:hypothetical protein Itr_chr02CG02100 [Ipomoea trifida]
MKLFLLFSSHLGQQFLNLIGYRHIFFSFTGRNLNSFSYTSITLPGRAHHTVQNWSAQKLVPRQKFAKFPKAKFRRAIIGARRGIKRAKLY